MKYKAIETAAGGYENKKLTMAFQTVILDDKDSDCGTQKTIDIKLDDKNINEYLYRYIQQNKKLVQITNENKNNFINTTVKMRSVLYCKGEHYCNKCVGDKFYLVGIKNVGLTAGNVGSIIMNDSMKSFHVQSIVMKEIKNISNFIKPQ